MKFIYIIDVTTSSPVAVLMEAVLIEPSGHDNQTLSDVRLSFYHYYRGLFVTHGQKNVRVCPCDVRAHRTRDAIWPDCISCPVRQDTTTGHFLRETHYSTHVGNFGNFLRKSPSSQLT
eukprot:scaffold25924_cov76-Attheya_sp.AAC.1